jgi:GntR family transcriptional repressor for pyruvate dehydrogenase complex
MTAADRQPQSRRVFEEIVLRIERMIAQGEVRKGDRLPPERQLAEAFRVSRHSVREAIRALEQKGILRSHVGDGTYVLAGAERDLVEPLARAILLGRDQLREIFEFRRLLEPQIAALAAGAASVEELAALRDLWERQKAASPEAAPAVDEAFHLQIVRATGNGILLRVFQQLQALLGESRSESLQGEARRLASIRTHGRILVALERRDGESARREMIAHLEEIEGTLLRS